MDIAEPIRTEPSYSCWDSPKVKIAYWTLTAIVAAGVIFGALVIISRYGNVPMGENMEYVIEGLGNYTFLPFAASSLLLVGLVILGIIGQGSDKSGFVDDGDVSDSMGDFTLIAAAARGDVESVQAHLQSGKFKAENSLLVTYADGYGAIHRAVMCQDLNNSLDIMRCLIAHDPNIVYYNTTPAHGSIQTTPLHLAVTQNGALAKVKLLVEAGGASSLEATDGNGDQPLFAALHPQSSHNPDIQILAYLLSHYADKNFPFDKIFMQKIESALIALSSSEDHKAWINDPETRKTFKDFGIKIKV